MVNSVHPLKTLNALNPPNLLAHARNLPNPVHALNPVNPLKPLNALSPQKPLNPRNTIC